MPRRLPPSQPATQPASPPARQRPPCPMVPRPTTLGLLPRVPARRVPVPRYAARLQCSFPAVRHRALQAARPPAGRPLARSLSRHTCRTRLMWHVTKRLLLAATCDAGSAADVSTHHHTHRAHCSPRPCPCSCPCPCPGPCPCPSPCSAPTNSARTGAGCDGGIQPRAVPPPPPPSRAMAHETGGKRRRHTVRGACSCGCRGRAQRWAHDVGTREGSGPAVMSCHAMSCHVMPCARWHEGQSRAQPSPADDDDD